MDFVLSYYADNVFLDNNFPNSKLPSNLKKTLLLFGMKEVALLKGCQNFVGVCKLKSSQLRKHWFNIKDEFSLL